MKFTIHEKCNKCKHKCKYHFSIKVEELLCKKYKEKKEDK